MDRLARVTRVSVRPPFQLDLGFADGTSGRVDLAPWLRGRKGMLEPLHDPVFFAQVRVDEEAGTVCWPNGADIDPDVLYEAVHTMTGG
jgi:hypothetical protein